MTYLDLEVLVTPGDGGRYDARVASDDGRRATTSFALPLALPDLVGVVHGLHPSATPVAPAPVPSPGDAARAAGQKLFQALFQGATRDILTGAMSRARAAGAAGVRIRLSLDLHGRDMAAVASLPWELMRRDDDDPFVVSSEMTFVRSIDTDKPDEPRPFKAPLRILAISSNPAGTTQLDLKAEAEAIGVSWAQLNKGEVVVDVVRPLPDVIQKALMAADYHVVHYMGHGGFYPDHAGGHLMLENEDRSIRWTPAEEFAAWLAGRSVRLVFLNACETARTSETTGLPPYAGVATALIRNGLTAVIGMQFTVSDGAAKRFSTRFYEQLVAGRPIDVAVTEARLALYPGKGPVEWATPVLYMRSHSGELVPELKAGPKEERTMAQDPDPPPAPPASQAGGVSLQGGINFSGSIGSNNTFGDNATSNQTVNIGSSVSTGSVTLPKPEDVNITAVVGELKALLAEIQAKAEEGDARKLGRAMGTVEDEVAAAKPDKTEIVNAMTTAVEVAKKSGDFAEQIKRLTPHVIQVAGWVGQVAAMPLLKMMGLG